MSSSRRRLRPLDPGEERAVHTTDPLQLTLLDDERSYCFSWPGAALTAWINGNLAYTEAHIYKSATGAAAAAAATSSTGIGSSGVAGTTGAAAAAAAAVYRDDGGAVPSAPIVTPPVFTVADLLSRGFGPPLPDDDEGEGYRGNEEVWQRYGRGKSQQQPPHPASSSSSWLHRPVAGSGVSSLSACQDVSHLLAPFVSRRSQGGGRGGGTDGNGAPLFPPSCSAVAMPCGGAITATPTPRATAHPLSPPRPLCTGEDSIFSLTESQARDAAVLGLITRDTATASHDSALSGTKAPREDEADVKLDPKKEEGSGEERKLAGPSDGAFLDIDIEKRRRLEWEIVGLEWRAFKQSQRTASALQRLLSLEAAVPFEPMAIATTTTTTTTAAGAASSARGKSSSASATLAGTTTLLPVSEDWRRAAHRLWLYWRVGGTRDDTGDAANSADVAALAETMHGRPGHAGTGGTDGSSPMWSGPTATPPSGSGRAHQHQQQPHLWGPPLMPGAYLYGTQSDYFLDPARTSAATTAGPAGAGGVGKGARGGRDAGGLAFANSRRRRGPYNFLSWKIEHYTPLLLAEMKDKGDDTARQHATRDSGVQKRSRSGRPSAATTTATDAAVVEDGKEAAPQLSLEHPAFAPIPTRRQRQWEMQQRREAEGDSGGTGGGNTLLDSQSVDTLVKKFVLARPLVEVEQDGEGGRERLSSLAWPDLKLDTEMWRTWLSKV